ncbi:probable inactive receptor kinase At2g26730 [Cornus florida]|uniref:probable inactive receptor kinase At2g26730 n=1 Tax=Cornus florida TaxID=4283 RepID=UPI00289D6BAD|nr:probable inactive receptor kinase At2g26730 [Cornus florida]
MQWRRCFYLLSKGLMCIAAFAFSISINVCDGGELSESKFLFNFIRAVDPKNILRTDSNDVLPHPCSHRWKGVKCNLQRETIVAIRLENLNLSGILDTDSLCKLPNLSVLNLAKNQIQGSIPDSILNCTKLTYLNLSGNLLNGRVPAALTKLHSLGKLDISNNHFTGSSPLEESSPKRLRKMVGGALAPVSKSSSGKAGSKEEKSNLTGASWIPLIIVFVFFLIFTYYVKMRADKLAKEKEILKSLAYSPAKTPPPKDVEEVQPEDRRSELVFFVEEKERFKLEDLLEAAADLQSQSLWSSLYKVKFENNATFAVKRLKKLQVSFEEFGRTMRKIGNLKHQNILPLVGYNSTNEEKLLIYKYQKNGSLLTLLEDYVDGKRDFPWKLRLSIAIGIARGLDYIYQGFDDELEIIPHGNIKLSNILLSENEEPLISEYGYSKFLDPKRASLLNSNGYTAPEKSLSEQADVFSFGVILLELLTGKLVGKSGLDLPKWVKSMVREEWTGEVFDKEVAMVGMYAFPLLNISLKCVAHFPENRPSIAEVLEKIEEIVNAHEELSPTSSVSDMDSKQQDCCFLHSVVPETRETPGSNQ